MMRRKTHLVHFQPEAKSVLRGLLVAPDMRYPTAVLRLTPHELRFNGIVVKTMTDLIMVAMFYEGDTVIGLEGRFLRACISLLHGSQSMCQEHHVGTNVAVSIHFHLVSAVCSAVDDFT